MGAVFVTNSGNLAARKRVLAGQTEERYRRAADTQKRKMLWVAQSLSGGRLTKSDLRRLGHPYAKRLPPGAAGQPDFIINRGRGNFARQWHGRVQRTSKGWTISVWNASPEAKFLLGGPRSKMRLRGIMQEILRRTGDTMPKEVKKAAAQAVRDNAFTAQPMGAGMGLAYAVAVGVMSGAGAVERAL